MSSKLYYKTQGSGPPLILIPGFASGAWIWNWQTGPLAEKMRVITFDPRGIGRSEVEDQNELTHLTLGCFASDVLGIMDRLEIEKANVLGASFGGFVAQQFALSFPDRLNKLILACTGFGGSHHVAPAPEILLAFASTDGMNTSERIRKFMAPAFSDEFNALHPETVEEVCRLREASIVPETVYLAQMKAATTFDFEYLVGGIKHETLVLTGDRDRVVPMQNSFNLAAKMPRAQIKLIEGGSHMFFVERAGEFNEIVSEFVNC
ncbi:MAG: alpha/beta hydrolase [Pyrinomonadaceae bacterium]